MSGSITKALGYASPDSPAAKYAKMQQLLWLAYEAHGVPGKSQEAAVHMRMFATREICFTGGGNGDYCAKISGERFDKDFRLADFNYDNIPITEIVLPPGRPEGTRDLGVTLIAGQYVPGTSNIQLVFDLSNNSKSKVTIPTDIFYRDSGKVMEPYSWTGSTSLEPNERSMYFVRVHGQRPGAVSFTPQWEGRKADPYWIRVP
jgi:Tfp pilus tip-associated adhesin PilY1